VSKDHKLVKGLIKAYSDATGKPGYAFAIGGGTYSRCMPNTVAFGLNFPGDPDPCHMADEYLNIEKMMLSARIMARAIAELAGKHE
ncbi:MAG: dipeptidase PepV, partial [Clostridia bacterium]|nr:dipeptidase PepV [Clostridia bacterium]